MKYLLTICLTALLMTEVILHGNLEKERVRAAVVTRNSIIEMQGKLIDVQTLIIKKGFGPTVEIPTLKPSETQLHKL